MGFKTLRNFSDSELIFDDEQTRLILQTIFKNHLDVVDMLSIDRKVRNFAQETAELVAKNQDYPLGLDPAFDPDV